MGDDAAFRAFVETNGATLLHTARLIAGDHHRGEDLVQTTLAKLYPRFRRVRDPLAYTRRALMNSQIDSTRRRSTTERPVEVLPEVGSLDHAPSTDERDVLRRLLAELGPRERAVIVLRYYCDLSELQTAATLGLPLGTVKSSAARALARLRIDAQSAQRSW